MPLTYLHSGSTKYDFHPLLPQKRKKKKKTYINNKQDWIKVDGCE